jgi:hypothetical protein|tara:strand:+ start:519 stop:725 length:207 start_codon:yes stop_codon:yes gene_type:complete
MLVQIKLNKKQIGMLNDIVLIHLLIMKSKRKKSKDYVRYPISYIKMVERILNKLPNISTYEMYNGKEY